FTVSHGLVAVPERSDDRVSGTAARTTGLRPVRTEDGSASSSGATNVVTFVTADSGFLVLDQVDEIVTVDSDVTGLSVLLRNLLQTGGVVVTGPSGTLGLLMSRTRSGLLEKPGNEHRTPRSTVHPEPFGNGIRVISTALGVFTDALLSERDDVTGRTLTATDVLVLLL